MNGPDVNPNDPSQENDPFAAQPPAPAQDFSEYEDPLPDIGRTDRETMSKINRHTTPMGKVMTVVILLGSAGLAYWAYQQNIAYDTRMDDVHAAGQLEGDAMLAGLRQAYSNATHDDVRERILLNLGAFDDKQSIPLMIEALNTKGIVRRAGARALAHIGSPEADSAKAKLLQVLPKTDARDRPQVVWALAVLREQGAIDAILEEFAAGHLQNLEGLDDERAFDPKVISDVVGPARLSSDSLIKHENKSIRTLVAKALSETTSPEVIPALITMLQDEDEEVVKHSAAALGRSGDDRAGQPLFELLKRRPGMRHSVLEGIGQSTSAPGIAKLIESADSVDLKRSLASLLSKTHDPRAADALAKQLNNDDADLLQIAALGLAELGDARAVPALVTLADHEDRDTALDAIDALATLERPEVASALLPMLDKHPGRKAGLLKAIGASGDTAAGAAVARHIDSDDREAASFAAADLNYMPAYKQMLGALKRPPNVDFSRPSVSTEEIVRDREIAIRALGHYGLPEAVPGLMTLIEDEEDSAKLRLIAGSVLGQLADVEVLGQIVQKAKDQALSEDVRKVYVRGLWASNVSEGSGQLMELLQPSVNQEIRRAVALAVGYQADPANDAALLKMLENPQLRRDAAFAIVLGGTPEAGAVLYKTLNGDRELREVMQDVMMQDDIDWFSRISDRSFASGQIFRRLAVAEELRLGEGDLTFTHPWNQLIERLKLGWAGTNGLSAREIRAHLWKALRGKDADKRRLAAEALSAMKERGLLLAARDETGPGQEEARAIILRSSQPVGS